MSEIRVDTISEKTSANGVTIDGLTIKDGAITATTGSIVFNEASADVDFRVESNGNANMLFVDGGNNRVGIGGTGASYGQIGIENAGDAQIDLFSNVGSGTVGKAEIFFSSDSGSDHVSMASIVMIQDGAGDRKGEIRFNVSDNGGPATAVTIANNKNVTFAAGLLIGGTGAANTLDDYEEGTWTPTLGDSSGNNATLNSSYSSHGYYTKIGRMVHAHCYIIVTSLGSASGSAVLSGLPFTNTNNNRASTSGTVSYGNNLNLGDGKSLGFYVRPNLTNGFMYNHNSSDGGATASCAEISANGEFMMSVTYTID